MNTKFLILSLLTIFSLSAKAEVMGEATLNSDLTDEEIDLYELYDMDLVHSYIKNNPNCGQHEYVQVFEYDELSGSACVNMGVNLLTVFNFDEPIKSYMISDPEETGFFNVQVWIEKQDMIDNSYAHKKSYTVKASYPNKSANIVFLADSGREYYFDLKSVDMNSDEIPTKKVYSTLSEELKAEVRKKEEEQKAQKEESLIENAKKINYEDGNVFEEYMERIHGLDINTSYKLYSFNDGESIKPWSVYDDGKRTYFNFDGTLGTNSMPSISRVLNGIDIPQTIKEAYTISPSYKGWVYVDTISQEGFTLSLGAGKKAKVLCIKPSVDLREFYNKQKKKPLIEIDFETGKQKAIVIKKDNEEEVVLKTAEKKDDSVFGKIKNFFKSEGK